MKLLTREVKDAFLQYPLYSQDGKGDDAVVVAKFFDPVGRFTFFATEGEEEEGDFTMFGYVVSPLGADCDEKSYVSMNELQSVKHPFFRTGIERDISFPVGSMKLGDALSIHRKHTGDVR